MLIEAGILGAVALASGTVVRAYERARCEQCIAELEVDLQLANRDAGAAQNGEALEHAARLRAERDRDEALAELAKVRQAAAEREAADDAARSPLASLDFSAAGKVGRVFDVPLFDRARGPAIEILTQGARA